LEIDFTHGVETINMLYTDKQITDQRSPLGLQGVQREVEEQAAQVLLQAFRVLPHNRPLTKAVMNELVQAKQRYA
jgi:hypothetical protein